MEFLDIFLIFITFLVAGFLENLIGGGGGLLILPVLFALGVDPLIAITTILGAFLGTSSFSLLKFKKEGELKIDSFILYFIFYGLIGAFIGLNIIIDLDKEFLKNLVNSSLVLMLFFLFIPKKFSFNLNKKNSLIIGAPFFLFLGIYSSIIGGGAGFIATFLFLFFTSLPFKKITIYRLIIAFLMCLISTIFHFFHGNLDFQLILIGITGGSIGGWFGTHFFIKLDEKILKKLFAFVVVLMVILNYI